MNAPSDDLVHDLSDRLNSIEISVELAIQLLEQSDAGEALQTLKRVRGDCQACGGLMSELRGHPRET